MPLILDFIFVLTFISPSHQRLVQLARQTTSWHPLVHDQMEECKWKIHPLCFDVTIFVESRPISIFLCGAYLSSFCIRKAKYVRFVLGEAKTLYVGVV
jgi:hypothetical protein